jgi:hypothetical protein
MSTPTSQLIHPQPRTLAVGFFAFALLNAVAAIVLDRVGGSAVLIRGAWVGMAWGFGNAVLWAFIADRSAVSAGRGLS